MAKKSEEPKDEKTLTPQEQLKSILKLNSEDHFNHIENNDYKVSSGSLKFDIELGGGISPGITRMTGISEGGKTSSSLAFLNNFLKESTSKTPRRGLIIKAEGRLSEEIKDRSGVTYVEKEEEWTDGTCFILKSNIFEVVISVCRTLIKDNPTNTKYFVIFDSMDALISKNDMAKSAEEGERVGSTAMISASFLKRMALSFNSLGHCCVMISQIRSQIQINPYEKKEHRLTPASGGNALTHNASVIAEFMPRFNDDMIWEDSTKKKRIGHYAKVKLDKTTNEKTGTVVSYPIKYGRKNGTSIWTEYEVFDLLQMYEAVTKKGAWLVFNETWRKQVQEHLDFLKKQKELELEKAAENEAKKLGISKIEFLKEHPIEKVDRKEVPEQIHGQDKLLNYLEENQDVCKFLYEKFKSTLLRG